MTLQTLIDTIVERGGISESRAHHVVRVYRRLDLLTLDASHGYGLKRGELIDRDVIERAANMALPDWQRSSKRRGK